MYEAYTLSDQVWTPQLPAHWEFQRAKCIFDSPKEKNEGNKESNVLSLTLKGVIHNSKENPIGLSPADYATYCVILLRYRAIISWQKPLRTIRSSIRNERRDCFVTMWNPISMLSTKRLTLWLSIFIRR